MGWIADFAIQLLFIKYQNEPAYQEYPENLGMNGEFYIVKKQLSLRNLQNCSVSFSYNQQERKKIYMDMILKTRNLCKQFKGQMAVNNVSLNIEKNTVYGLLGPNGAGKSTTLKMITGILKQTSGSIEFNGHHWKRDDLSEIGALIEMPPLYENLTAYENLKVRTLMLGLDEARIDEVLQIVRLTDTKKKRAGQFSLGMKQRLGIALALLNSPKLLILDEPTNGLDPVGIEELRELIRSFPAKGITVILSSHILSEVQQIADHIGIIAGGVLEYEGELQAGQNLEELFMDVVRKHSKEGC